MSSPTNIFYNFVSYLNMFEMSNMINKNKININENVYGSVINNTICGANACQTNSSNLYIILRNKVLSDIQKSVCDWTLAVI